MNKAPSRLRRQIGGGWTGRPNIYVAKADQEIWEKAARFAREHGVSLSSVVADALARYLENPPA